MSTEAPPRRRYKPGDFDLKVKRASAGLGLFAVSTIPKGACVIEYTGTPITREQMYTSNSRYLFEINSRKTIDGSPRWNTARYINHSCRPNCEIEIHKGRVWIFARRNIKPGEELGYDYGEAYVEAYLSGKCLCAACAPKTKAA
ncbi:MAG: SET domain-containing protein [Hyphomonadaceae bacterium]